MTDSLRFAEAVSLQDLATYIKRARRIQEQGIRLQAVGQVLAAWVPVMTPGSLLSQLPAVLGLRTVALAEASTADVTAELSSISERIARMNPAETELSLPPSRLSVPWAAVTPPRSGWEPLGTLRDDHLRAQAQSGIAQITEAVPTTAGAAVVEQVREGVWGRDLETDAGAPAAEEAAAGTDAGTGAGTDSENQLLSNAAIPAGAAFGAHALNFLAAEGAGGSTAVHRRGRWIRLSSQGGYILCRSTREPAPR